MRILASSVLLMGSSALVIALSGCSDDLGDSISEFLIGGGGEAIASTTFNGPPDGTMPYGVEGSLDEKELLALLYLQFPQSYTAIKDRLGFPAQRDATADYYRIEGTSNWVVIWYDETGRAVSYQLSD